MFKHACEDDHGDHVAGHPDDGHRADDDSGRDDSPIRSTSGARGHRDGDLTV
jgi:hypothetical protein